MPYYSITYHEGTHPPRTGKQLIYAPDDAEAKRIAAEVCQGGRFNGYAPRVIQNVERV